MTIFVHQNDLPDDFKPANIVAIDTETTGLNFHRDRLCLLQISNGDGDAHLVQFTGDYNAPNLVRILTDEKITKLFHLALFDVSMIFQHLGVLTYPIYCTKIASRLCRTYTQNHGLKVLCEEILNIKISKQQQSSDWGAPELTQEQQDYAASDVLYLHGLKEYMDKHLERENRLDLALSCFEFLPTRAILEIDGWGGNDIFTYNFDQRG